MSESRRRVVASVALFVVLLTGCEAAVLVQVDVADDGSGTVAVSVQLDAEAVARVPDLENELRTEDLIEAGWEVEGPRAVEGAIEIRATKPFGAPEQLNTVMEELTGPEGAFRDFELVRERSFGETSFELTGTMDFSGGLAPFADAELVRLLDGEPFGASIEELEAAVGPLADAVPIELVIRLPGAGEGTGTTFRARLDDTQPIDVRATASDENLVAKMLRWVAIAAFILFGVAVVLGVLGFLLERLQRRRPQVRTPEPVRNRVPVGASAGGGEGARVGPAPAAPLGAGARPRTERRLGLVVVDTIGVIYRRSDDPLDLLAPFARDHGSPADNGQIVDLYRLATLGRITTAELWTRLGVEGDPDELDEAYTSLVRMSNGAADFLREMGRRRVSVAALSNDALEWSRILRTRDHLEMISPWIVSGEVGVRKPDPGIFEALRRSTGVPYEDCLMIDDELANLDAARTVGMSTVWFTNRRPPADLRPAHPVVTSFAEFFRRRS